MVNKILNHTLRSLIGLVFIYSAYSKLYPAEPFELFIYSHGIFNWLNSTIIVRLIIGIELFLGLFLLLNIYSKQILKTTLFILSAFTIYLIYIALFKPEITDCNCFGTKFKLTPGESIIKNVILIAITIYLLYKNKSFEFKKLLRKILLISSTILTLALPFILSPPDAFIKSRYQSTIDETKLDSDIIGDFSDGNKQLSIKKGKALVCFFSMQCKFCQMTAEKISITVKRNHLNIPVYYIFFGPKENLQYFWDNSQSIKFPYKIIDTATFFNYSGKSLPSIMFIDNEEIKIHAGYRTLDDQMILDFFKK